MVLPTLAMVLAFSDGLVVWRCDSHLSSASTREAQ